MDPKDTTIQFCRLTMIYEYLHNLRRPKKKKNTHTHTTDLPNGVEKFAALFSIAGRTETQGLYTNWQLFHHTTFTLSYMKLASSSKLRTGNRHNRHVWNRGSYFTTKYEKRGENRSLELKSVVTAVTELQIDTLRVASAYSALTASSHEGTESAGTRNNSNYIEL